VPYERFQEYASGEIRKIRDAGLLKSERVLASPQQPRVAIRGRESLLNLCANNYLGLADHPAILAAAREALARWGYGMASVRFICGTQEPHQQLEQALAGFLGTEATILYSSCWDGASSRRSSAPRTR
jgi:glycine C-acetyltransferase